MSKFVKCWHPDVEGEAEFIEASLPHQMAKGWSPVEPEPVDEPKPKVKSSEAKAKKTESPKE